MDPHALLPSPAAPPLMRRPGRGRVPHVASNAGRRFRRRHGRGEPRRHLTVPAADADPRGLPTARVGRGGHDGGVCGRYASARAADDLASHYDARVGAEVPADYNVAPTATVPVVLAAGNGTAPGERLLTAAVWGFRRPAGTGVVINARTETVAERALFARSFRTRRCLLPADGWYEWVHEGGAAQPYFLAPDDAGVLSLAGLFRVETGEEGAATLRVVVITGAAGERLRWLHTRTPMLVSAAGWDAWLDSRSAIDPHELLEPATAAGVRARRVGREVNSVASTGPGLTTALAETPVDTLF